MNGLNYDPGLRKAIAQQHFERRFAESENARLISISSEEKAAPKEIKGLNLIQIIKSMSGRISQTGSSLLLALRAKNDTLNA
jgi:UDP-N-acetylglucosamine 2-epimerase